RKIIAPFSELIVAKHAKLTISIYFQLKLPISSASDDIAGFNVENNFKIGFGSNVQFQVKIYPCQLHLFFQCFQFFFFFSTYKPVEIILLNFRILLKRYENARTPSGSSSGRRIQMTVRPQ